MNPRFVIVFLVLVLVVYICGCEFDDSGISNAVQDAVTNNNPDACASLD
jgi:hypothetical protein